MLQMVQADEQMTIFDFLPQQESQQVDKKQQEVAICAQKVCNGLQEPSLKNKPMWDNPECAKDYTKLCNRWGDHLEDYKSNLPKGFACTGCCWYCSEAPQHGGKCKFECRRDK